MLPLQQLSFSCVTFDSHYKIFLSLYKLIVRGYAKWKQYKVGARNLQGRWSVGSHKLFMLYKVSSHDCLTHKKPMKSETVFFSAQKQKKVTLPFTSFTWVVWKVLGLEHRWQHYQQDFLFLSWYICHRHSCEIASHSI
jgi:hypothetical protein